MGFFGSSFYSTLEVKTGFTLPYKHVNWLHSQSDDDAMMI